jgi:hypothetical protein
MKAADYVLVPDIANRNGNSGGTNAGGMLGGLLPHGIGMLAGGISLKSKTADVVLTLTDVRSTEQVALEQGHAKKTDMGWGGRWRGLLWRLCRRWARVVTPTPRSARWWRWPTLMPTPRWSPI